MSGEHKLCDHLSPSALEAAPSRQALKPTSKKVVRPPKSVLFFLCRNRALGGKHYLETGSKGRPPGEMQDVKGNRRRTSFSSGSY